MPNLTTQMSCTFTLYKEHVYQLSFRYLDNCGISFKLKKQRKDDLSPVFAMSPRYLNIVGNTDFQNLTLRNARCKPFNDDQVILCIAVCTCYSCSPLYMVDYQSLDKFNNIFLWIVSHTTFTIISADLMIPETYRSHNHSAKLCRLYPKRFKYV